MVAETLLLRGSGDQAGGRRQREDGPQRGMAGLGPERGERQQREHGQNRTRTRHEQRQKGLVEKTRVGTGEEREQVEIRRGQKENQEQVRPHKARDREGFRQNRPRRHSSAHSERHLDHQPDQNEVRLERDSRSGQQSQGTSQRIRYDMPGQAQARQQ